jgi:hypothetical protein
MTLRQEFMSLALQDGACGKTANVGLTPLQFIHLAFLAILLKATLIKSTNIAIMR